MRWVLLACVVLATVGCSHEVAKSPTVTAPIASAVPCTSAPISTSAAQVHAIIAEKDAEIVNLKVQVAILQAQQNQSGGSNGADQNSGGEDQSTGTDQNASEPPAPPVKHSNFMTFNYLNDPADAAGDQSVAQLRGDASYAQPTGVTWVQFMMDAGNIEDLAPLVSKYGPPMEVVPEHPVSVYSTRFIYQCTDGLAAVMFYPRPVSDDMGRTHIELRILSVSPWHPGR
ncbi:MAG: hypothetical protein ACLQVD_08765 [Capsulimonadaceae bacterium]